MWLPCILVRCEDVMGDQVGEFDSLLHTQLVLSTVVSFAEGQGHARQAVGLAVSSCGQYTYVLAQAFLNIGHDVAVSINSLIEVAR